MRTTPGLLAAMAAVALAGPVPPALAGKQASVRIVNQSSWAIHQVYLSPTSHPRWGPDQLGRDVIQPGETYRLSQVDCDTYDVRLVDEDGDVCVVQGVDLCREDAVWRITSRDLRRCQEQTQETRGTQPASRGRRQAASVRIVNRSEWDIHRLFLSPVDDREWGPDQLGRAVIRAGATFTVTDIACNRYDVKLVDEDGDACVVEAVDLCRDDSVWSITNQALLACEGWR